MAFEHMVAQEEPPPPELAAVTTPAVLPTSYMAMLEQGKLHHEGAGNEPRRPSVVDGLPESAAWGEGAGCLPVPP